MTLQLNNGNLTPAIKINTNAFYQQTNGVMYSLIFTAHGINVCTYVNYLHGTRYCTDGFHKNKKNSKIKGFIINYPCQIDRVATVILLLSQFYLRKHGTLTKPRIKTPCYIIIILVLQVEDPIVTVSFSCPSAVFKVVFGISMLCNTDFMLHNPQKNFSHSPCVRYFYFSQDKK